MCAIPFSFGRIGALGLHGSLLYRSCYLYHSPNVSVGKKSAVTVDINYLVPVFIVLRLFNLWGREKKMAIVLSVGFTICVLTVIVLGIMATLQAESEYSFYGLQKFTSA